jgi:hypothetical protein
MKALTLVILLTVNRKFFIYTYFEIFHGALIIKYNSESFFAIIKKALSFVYQQTKAI